MSYSEFLERREKRFVEAKREIECRRHIKEVKDEVDERKTTIRTLYQENKFDDLFNFMFGTLFIAPNPAERSSLLDFCQTIRLFDRPCDIATSRPSKILLHYLGYDTWVFGESKDKHGYGFDTHKFLSTINFFFYEATERLNSITKNSETLNPIRQAIYNDHST